MRYFAAARAAAGADSEQLTVRPDATVGELVDSLRAAARNSPACWSGAPFSATV